MTTRKIMVADRNDDKTIEAEHYATFTSYIQGVAYQFVVTRAPLEHASRVTHKASGKSLGVVESSHISAANFDYKEAGKLALKAVCDKHGEARVASALRSIET